MTDLSDYLWVLPPAEGDWVIALVDHTDERQTRILDRFSVNGGIGHIWNRSEYDPAGTRMLCVSVEPDWEAMEKRWHW